MRIIVNGAPQAVEADATVAGIVELFAPSPNGIAVAVNAEVVPRSVWAATPVSEDDRIEVLSAAQGG